MHHFLKFYAIVIWSILAPFFWRALFPVFQGFNMSPRGFLDRALAVFYGVLGTLFLVAGAANFTAHWHGAQGVWVLAVLFVALALWMAFLARRRWLGGTHGGAILRSGLKAELADGEFYSRVVGTTHCNADGADRQLLIRAHCKPGAGLRLVREPENMHDPNAIAVFCGGVQIGYLGADMAHEYAQAIDLGEVEMTARVKDVTGGTSGKKSLGVNIVIKLRELE